jgi:chromosome segregation ATPase
MSEEIQVCAGIWKTRSGHAVEVRQNNSQLIPDFPWRGALFDVVEIWRNNGRWMSEMHYDHRDLVEYVGPLPQQTTTDTLAEIEEQIAECVQQDEAHTLRAELVQATAARDSLQQQLATMQYERDILAQRLVTKHSEKALQKQVGKQQIEINTLEDRLQDMTDDRETLRRQFEAMTADWDGLQAELAIAIESLQNERFQAQTAHAGCKRAEELLADMTAERDRLAAEATDAQRLAADLRGEVDFVRGQKTAQEHQLRAEIARLERGWRQAQIDLDAERETPAANCRAVVDAHLIGAQTGRQAAFEAVERWLEPLSGVDSEHAAAVLQALPGCIRKLAELEGVTW